MRVKVNVQNTKKESIKNEIHISTYAEPEPVKEKPIQIDTTADFIKHSEINLSILDTFNHFIGNDSVKPDEVKIEKKIKIEPKFEEEIKPKDDFILDEEIDLFSYEDFKFFSKKLDNNNSKILQKYNSTNNLSLNNSFEKIEYEQLTFKRNRSTLDFLDFQYFKNTQENLLYLSDIFSKVTLFGLLDVPVFLNSDYIKFLKIKIPKNIYTVNELKEYLMSEIEKEGKLLNNLQGKNFLNFF